MKFYVYYQDRGKELIFTWFNTQQQAEFAASKVGGYLK